MWFEQELKINQPFDTKEKQALYSLLRTASLFSKYADRFLSPHGLTESQYRILEILQQKEKKGMTQVEISGHLLVNRSNITGLIDRLEKNGFVMRSSDPRDRRINRIKLKEKARKILRFVAGLYAKESADLCAHLNKDEIKTMIYILGKIEKKLEQSPKPSHLSISKKK